MYNMYINLLYSMYTPIILSNRQYWLFIY